jgi:hypothetical protein
VTTVLARKFGDYRAEVIINGVIIERDECIYIHKVGMGKSAQYLNWRSHLK